MNTEQILLGSKFYHKSANYITVCLSLLKPGPDTSITFSFQLFISFLVGGGEVMAKLVTLKNYKQSYAYPVSLKE